MLIKVFTDGSCLGNPGSGGWAVIITTPLGIEKVVGYSQKATNNEMELFAALTSLKVINDYVIDKDYGDYEFEIFSDSAYVVNTINNDWLTKWKKSGWKTAKGMPIKNKILWQHMLLKMLILKKNNIKFTFKKVKGHSGNSYNEMVDKLAREQALIAQKLKKEGK